jgi:hypothetical protein
MMAMDVIDDNKSMEILVEGVGDDGSPCKKHSKVASSKACKTKLGMEVKPQ